jgi:uncharacterized membrane protein
MLKHFSQTTGPQRLVYAVVAGTAAALAPWPLDKPGRALVGWIVTAAIYLGLSAWLALEFDSPQIRQRAKAQHESTVVLFLVMVLAVCASVAAIVVLLRQAKGMSPDARALHVALSAMALAASWLWIHVLFAFHYAHRYYQAQDVPEGAPKDAPKERGAEGPGLAFPQCDAPDYFDFLYHALVVGMTSQVSDVQVTSGRMRRVTALHGLLSFAFNVVVLAMGINVVASSLQ